MILFYFTPFLPLYGYIFSNDYEWTWLAHQRNALTDLINLKIAIVGLMGILGMYLGMSISNMNYSISNTKFHYPSKKILNKSQFIFWSFLCLFFSFLSAPSNTIFEAAYFMGESTKLFSIVNFNAGFLISYIIACFLYIDYERDKSGLKKMKKYIWYFSFFTIVLFFQILRGDREFIGLILGYSLIRMYEPFRNNFSINTSLILIKKKLKKYLLFGSILIILLLYIGIVRFSAAEGTLLITGLFMNAPWKMTTLSFLAFFSDEKLSVLQYGKSYLDYLLSIVPTFVYKIFGFDSPSWSNNIAANLVETNLTSGGSHVSLVPLSNFGIYGVFIILFIYSFSVVKLEKKAITLGSIYFMIWISLVISLPFWFWYGEMAAIRGLMASTILYYIFQYKLKR